MGQGCSVSTREDVQLWMLPPTSYGITAEPGAFPVAWFGGGYLHYHHSNAPCLVSAQIKQSKPQPPELCDHFWAGSRPRRMLVPLRREGRAFTIPLEPPPSLSCFLALPKGLLHVPVGRSATKTAFSLQGGFQRPTLLYVITTALPSARRSSG